MLLTSNYIVLENRRPQARLALMLLITFKFLSKKIGTGGRLEVSGLEVGVDGHPCITRGEGLGGRHAKNAFCQTAMLIQGLS